MIRIIHVSDLHFGRDCDDATETGYLLLEQVYAQYQFQNAPDTYLLATGDLVDGRESVEFDQQWQDAATAFEKFKGKLLVCAGNHDLGWWGSIEKYREFCKYLDLPGDCSVASQLRNNSTTIDLLGLDSTWWCPGLGIAGVGRIDDDELAAAKAFADKSSKGWKLLYLHHRPIEPSLSEETKQSIANGSVDETTALDLRKPFLGLMGAEALLDTVAGNVDLLTFGHDKDYLTDITDHARPVWVNCNREDSRNGGWIELTFDDKQCTMRAYDDLGQQRREQILSRS